MPVPRCWGHVVLQQHCFYDSNVNKSCTLLLCSSASVPTCRCILAAVHCIQQVRNSTAQRSLRWRMEIPSCDIHIEILALDASKDGVAANVWEMTLSSPRSLLGRVACSTATHLNLCSYIVPCNFARGFCVFGYHSRFLNVWLMSCLGFGWSLSVLFVIWLNLKHTERTDQPCWFVHNQHVVVILILPSAHHDWALLCWDLGSSAHRLDASLSRPPPGVSSLIISM